MKALPPARRTSSTIADDIGSVWVQDSTTTFSPGLTRRQFLTRFRATARSRDEGLSLIATARMTEAICSVLHRKQLGRIAPSRQAERGAGSGVFDSECRARTVPDLRVEVGPGCGKPAALRHRSRLPTHWKPYSRAARRRPLRRRMGRLFYATITSL